MGRKRAKANQNLPPYVYKKRGNWIYRPYLGRKGGKTLRGETVYLCPVNAPMSDLWKAYERVTKSGRGTVKWLLGLYMDSPKVAKLAAKTQAGYADDARLMCSRKSNGKAFGDVPLGQITRKTIRTYLDTYPAPVAANRHISLLKAAWNWALERHDDLPDNPCVGVRLNDEESRTRYVEPHEVEAVKHLATGYVPLFIEIAYLCRARFNEIAALKVGDIKDEGLLLRRSKGSIDEITAWSPRLRAVIDACLAYNNEAPSPISGGYLIHNKRGEPIKYRAFRSAWVRLMDKWSAKGGEYFTFHDLKAAGVSDHATNASGHRSDAMKKVYVRKAQLTEATR